MLVPSATARLVVDTAALVANWRTFDAASGAASAGAAIKANGYGLGVREVLGPLAAAGCRDAYVAHWAEVAALGPIPDSVRVAVLHGVAASEMAVAAASPARPVLITPAQVMAWRETGRACDVMVDTGRNRLGLTPDDAVSGLLDGLAIDTLHSHLACSEDAAHPMNEAQRRLFAEVAARVPARRRALASSAGIGFGSDYHFDHTRPGVGLFGGGPGPGGLALAPVVSIEAPILQLRDVPVGASVGYGASFVASRPTRVAVVGLGYADGYPRSAAGSAGDPITKARGQGWVDDVACPLIGRVSMDMTCFDVTDAPALVEGTFFQVDFDLARIALASGRTEYELLTGLGARYARVYR